MHILIEVKTATGAVGAAVAGQTSLCCQCAAVCTRCPARLDILGCSAIGERLVAVAAEFIGIKGSGAVGIMTVQTEIYDAAAGAVVSVGGTAIGIVNLDRWLYVGLMLTHIVTTDTVIIVNVAGNMFRTLIKITSQTHNLPATAMRLCVTRHTSDTTQPASTRVTVAVSALLILRMRRYWTVVLMA